MNEVVLSKNIVTPELTPGEVIVLKLIYDQNKAFFKHFSDTYHTYISNLLKSLQKKLYIKITSDEFEGLALRHKADLLFKGDNINSNISAVIEYLNEKLEKKRGFSIKSKGNRKFIRARLQEGYTVDDLTSVIDVMYSKWIGTNMEMYLRPETIFNETKFQGYFSQVESVEEKDISVSTDKV